MDSFDPDMTPLDPSLVRQAADGELDAAALAALEAEFPDPADRDRLDAAVRFEQSLRARVGASLVAVTPPTPAGLAERIAAAMAAEPDAPEVDVVPGSADRFRRRQAIAGGFSWAAVAAVIALVVGAIGFGIYGPSIDRIGPSGAGTVNPQGALVADAVNYAATQHGRNTCVKTRTAGVQAWDGDVLGRIRIALGQPEFQIPDLSGEGFAFFGAARCDLPCETPSVQLLFESTRGGSTPAMVSVFLAPNDGQFGTERSDVVFEGDCPKESDPQGLCSRGVCKVTGPDLVAFVVCCRERDRASVTTAIKRALLR